MKYLIVVDMQNDFITGSLGTKEAWAILPNVIEKVKNFKGEVIFTRDTHAPEYLTTQEGRNLPVEHCIKGTWGWALADELNQLAQDSKCRIFDKPTFGSVALAQFLAQEAEDVTETENAEETKNPEIAKPVAANKMTKAEKAGHAQHEQIEEIELCGLCTDICVISNALMIKAWLPEVPVTVDASCCAGVTPQSHNNALAAMKMCQIAVTGETVSE